MNGQNTVLFSRGVFLPGLSVTKHFVRLTLKFLCPGCLEVLVVKASPACFSKTSSLS